LIGTPAQPSRVGVESFSLTSDINNEGGPVIASGVINDTGQDIVVSDTEDTFDFGARGRITVFHSPLERNKTLLQQSKRHAKNFDNLGSVEREGKMPDGVDLLQSGGCEQFV
jgi:hypothetical protein